MADMTFEQTQAAEAGPSAGQRQGKARNALSYLARNRALLVGIVMLGSLFLFSIVGALVWDTEQARALSASASLRPSSEHPLGTDTQGRDILAVMIAGTPLTLRIGLVAGLIGVGVGTILGFTAAYYGGVVDTVIRGIVDTMLTVPGLLVLLLIAVTARSSLSVNQMALVVAILAWLWPTRTIRGQVLSMRERPYVEVARLSGESGPEIIFKEMMPNLLPFLAAALVGATASAVLASIGLEALGLGPIESPTIGMTFYWIIYNSALLLGMWWWFIPPIVIIVILFIGLFNLSVGLDEWANPRLRRSV